MLYNPQPRRSIFVRIAALYSLTSVQWKRFLLRAELDRLGLSAHLRRDIGLE
ncbi:MAG: hypothetical protein JWR75_1223 [Devosia sp.]|nr:hypothetical protein [Devosia sp.]